MRWLLIRMILIVVVLVGAASAAVVIGRQQPVPPRVAMLHLTDCQLPCWIGIIPGVTPMDEARQKLLNLYGNLPAYKIEFDNQNESYYISDVASGRKLFGVNFEDTWADGTVGQIAMLLQYDQDEQTLEWKPSIMTPSVGELATALGQPTNMSEWPLEGDSPPAVQYENYQVALLPNPNVSRSNSIILEISTSADSLYIESDRSWQASQQYIPHVWAGFRKYEDLGNLRRP